MDIQAVAFLIMEIVGTIAFAASGAMVAIHRHMDVFGVCVLGVITAVGGGMTRDVVIGRVPAALQDPLYVIVAAAASVAVFSIFYFHRELFLGKTGAWYERAMLIMDSIGLGIFTAFGVKTGIDAGYVDNTFLLAFLGTVTGVGGGLLRDMMAGVAPYIFVRHVYACASIVGAVVCIYVYRTLGELAAMVISAATVMLIRYLAAHYRWNLPRINTER